MPSNHKLNVFLYFSLIAVSWCSASSGDILTTQYSGTYEALVDED